MTEKPVEQSLEEELQRFDERLKSDGYGTLLRTIEVEKALSCSRKTIYRLVEDDQLEAIRLNHEYRYPRESVARYMALGSVRPHKPA